MRRTVLILALLLLAAALYVVFAMRSASAVERRLEEDKTALRARTITRALPVSEPVHDNGFACLEGLLKVTPADLTPFGGAELLPWVRGDKPMTELPEAAGERLRMMAQWADSLRACGASRDLRFTETLTPWSPRSNQTAALTALTHLTALETWRDYAQAKPADAAARCEVTLNVLLDQTHFGVSRAREALALSTDVLLPVCARVWSDVPSAARSLMAPRWVFTPRVAPWEEALRTELVAQSATLFAAPEGSWLKRFEVQRAHAKWDERARAFVSTSGTPELARAQQELRELTKSLALSTQFPEQGDDERADYQRRLAQLEVLTWLARGASGEPPYGKRVDAGLELDGRVIPLPQ